jgi:tRNA1(Val) A37 N6-methylase TrmN6
LIIANPPYFFERESSLSGVDLNDRARFFLDADLMTLLRGIRNALSVGGRAYVLMKSGKEHGRDAFTSARIELFDCSFERLADIRGTDLVRITRD